MYIIFTLGISVQKRFLICKQFENLLEKTKKMLQDSKIKNQITLC